MQGSDLRWLREQAGLSVAEFSEALAMDPQHVRQLERGFKYSGRQPVAVSKVVELAAIAIHAGHRSFEATFPEQAAVAKRPTVLSERVVTEPLQASAIRKLAKRNIDIGPLRFFFEWETFLVFWPEIDAWCRDKLHPQRRAIKMYPLLKSGQKGGGIAIVEFPDENSHFEFKLRWIGLSEDAT